MTKGFTIVEILVSITILLLILAIGLFSFSNARNRKELHSIADTLVIRMEEAKTNAISGKYGDSFGVKFEPSSYTLFHGTSYSSSDPDNEIYQISDSFEIDTTITNSDEVIIFERLSGETSSNETITISEKNDSSNTISISVGTLGNISVVE